MRFNVPFVPNDELVRFLNERSDSFYSCHFSLHSEILPDARHKYRLHSPDELIETLTALEIPKKYLLMNSRVHSPENYFDKDHLDSVVRILTKMQDAGAVDGVVFTDAYYLQALSDAGGGLLSGLEAVPSVNCILDSFDRIAAILDFIATTNFRAPETIILDRSLNRKMDALSEVSERTRERYPDLKLELLANEGCLYQCPFKPAHDCHIAQVNLGEPLDTFKIADRLGCMRVFRNNPSQVFKSPFIRPEDVSQYEGKADILKFCGRTLGPAFLMRVIDAYLKRSYAGSLLELLDVTDKMATWMQIPNENLPADFHRRLTSCTRMCDSCSYCRSLFDLHAKRKELRIPCR